MKPRKLVVAKESTKLCPECGSRFLARLGTLRKKMCVDCRTDIVWERSEGQGSVHGGPKTESESG